MMAHKSILSVDDTTIKNNGKGKEMIWNF